MTPQIELESTGENRFRVAIHAGPITTEHDVTVPSDLIAALGLGESDQGRLVRASFVFLLEREGPESILRRFDLDVIGRYFPEYQSTIGDRLRSSPG